MLLLEGGGEFGRILGGGYEGGVQLGGVYTGLLDVLGNEADGGVEGGLVRRRIHICSALALEGGRHMRDGGGWWLSDIALLGGVQWEQ